jgi:hypothetical protein
MIDSRSGRGLYTTLPELHADGGYLAPQDLEKNLLWFDEANAALAKRVTNQNDPRRGLHND